MPDYTITVKIDTSQANRGIQDTRKGLDDVGQTASKVGNLVQQALAFVGLTASVQQIIQLSDAFTNLENRLKLVTNGQDELAAATQKVLDIANRTGQSVNAVADIYSKTILATDDLGVSTSDATTFVDLLSQALATSGASAQTTEGILYQLGQALGANKLAGDEFRATLEGAPIILDVLSAALNKSKAEILDMARAGEITAPILISSFLAMSDIITGPFNTATLTIAQAFNVLTNNLTVYVGELGKTTGAQQAFVNTILFVANNLDTFARIIGAVSIALGVNFAVQAVGAAVRGLQILAAAALANPFTALIAAITIAISFLITFGDQIKLTSDGSVTALSVLQDAWNALVDVVSTVVSTIIDLAVQMGDRIAQAFELSGLQDTFQQVWDSIVQIVDDAIATIESTLGDVDFSQAFDLQPLVDNFVTFTNLVFQILNDFVSSLGTFFTGAGNVIRSFVDYISTNFPQLGGIFETVLNTVIDLFNQFLDVLANFSFQDLLILMAREADLIIAIFAGLFAAVEELFSNWDTVLYDLFATGMNSAIDAIEEGARFIVDGLEDLPQTLFGLGVNAITALADGIIDTFEVVLEFASRIPGLLKDAITGEISVFDLGAEFAAALSDSILEGFEVAYDTTVQQFQRLETESEGAAVRVGESFADGFQRSQIAAPVETYLTGELRTATQNSAQSLQGELPSLLEPAFRLPSGFPIFEIPMGIDTTEVETGLNNVKQKVAETNQGVVGPTTVSPAIEEANQKLIKLEASQKAAVESMTQGFSDFLGLTEEQFGSFVRNADQLLRNFGVNIAGIFRSLPESWQGALASLGTDFANALGIAGIVLDELGIKIDDVFGKKAGTAIRIFSRLSSDQLDLIIRAGQGVVTFFAGPFATAIQNIPALFGGAADAAGGFFDGIIAAGQKVLSFFGVDLGTAASTAFDGIVAAGQKVLDYFGIDLTGVIEKVKGVFGGMGDVAQEEGGKVEEAGTGIAETFKQINDVITDIVDTIIGVFERLAIGIQNILTSIATGISNFISIVAQGIGQAIVVLSQAIGQGIIAIAAGVAEAILSIGLALAVVLAALAPFIAVMLVLSVLLAAVSLVLFAIAAIIEALAELIEALVPIVLALIDAFSEFGFSFDSIFAGMEETVRLFGEIFTQIITIAIESVVLLFQAMAEIIITIFETIGQVVQLLAQTMTAIFQAFAATITALFQALGAAITAIFQALGAAITAIAQALTAVFQAFGAAVTAIFQALGAAITAIFQAIGAAAQAIASAMTATFQALGAAISAIFQALGAAISAIFQAVGAAAQAVGQAISSAFQAAASAATAVMQGFGSAISGIMDAIGSAVRLVGDIIISTFEAGAAVIAGIIKIARELIGLMRELAAAARDAAEAMADISLPGGGGGGGGLFGGLPDFGIFGQGGTVLGKSMYMAPKGSVLSNSSSGNLAAGGMFTQPSLIFGPMRNKLGSKFDFGLVGEAGPERISPMGANEGGGNVINEFNISVRGASQQDIDKLILMVRELEGSISIISEETAIDVADTIFGT